MMHEIERHPTKRSHDRNYQHKRVTERREQTSILLKIFAQRQDHYTYQKMQSCGQKRIDRGNDKCATPSLTS